jgi:vitamin-K-epoxide reductase (warfarin-sensitive)
MNSRLRGLYMAIAVLAFAGIIVSSFSLYHHYGTSETSFCNIGEYFNCDLVNRSIYSSIAGIPVALIGIVGYVVLFVLATIFRGRRDAPNILLGASFCGFAFALYLTYIEKFVLAVWCILCLSSLGTILTITVLSGFLAASARRS